MAEELDQFENLPRPPEILTTAEELEQFKNPGIIAQKRIPYSPTPEVWVDQAIKSLKDSGEIPPECTSNQEPTKLEATFFLRKYGPKESQSFENRIDLELRAMQLGELNLYDPIPWTAGAEEHLKVIYVLVTKANEREQNMYDFFIYNDIVFHRHGKGIRASGPLVAPIDDTGSLLVLMCLNPVGGLFQNPKRFYVLAENTCLRDYPTWESYGPMAKIKQEPTCV